jgi:hypothetical protein
MTHMLPRKELQHSLCKYTWRVKGKSTEINEKIGNLIREIENVRKDQMEILQLRNILNKNVYVTLQNGNERTHRFEDISFQVVFSDHQTF